MTSRLPYRRLTLQLTPLLDLLLIVIFGQYLHVLHDRVTGAEVSQTAVAQAAELQRQVALLQSAAHEQEQRALVAELERRSTQADLERSLANQQVIGELLTELFKLPPDSVAQVLDPVRSPGAPLTAADQARLKTRFEQFARQSPGEMIEHLLSYDEIRKRCDVWELYVDSSNTATIEMGTQPVRTRVPVTADGQVDSSVFENDLYARYKGLPQSKTLVIMIFTYDRGTRISVTQPLRAMLPRLIARMQADSGGRSRFEFADLGFKLQ